MKILLSTLILFTAILSHATHNRFWLGQKKQTISNAEFVNGFNQIFFQEAVKVGAGKGLQAYMPYITEMTIDRPDEIALLIYETEDKYKEIRSTPEGKSYGDLHWNYFEKGSSSKSTVSVPFEGLLSVGGAFELNPQSNDWQKQKIHFFIYENNKTDLALLSKNFAELKKITGLYNSIILVTEKLIYEYRSVSHHDSIMPLPLNVVEQAILPSHTTKSFPVVQPGQGVNFQF